MKNLHVFLSVVVILTSCVLAEEPLLRQPLGLPGNWTLGKMQLPPLKDLPALNPSKRPVYGLYTWCHEYRKYHKPLREVGWTNFRIAGKMDDKTMALFVADNVEIMKTVGGKRRSEFETDEAFIADYVKGLKAFLKRYGPKGDFFKENPTLPHRPIQFVEIWNEPNFHYMVPNRSGVSVQEMNKIKAALYAKMLPAAYKAVKAEWPEVTVVGFGAGGASAADVGFIKAVFKANPKAAASFDILSTHPYFSASPDAYCVTGWGKYAIVNILDKIRQMMKADGGTARPVWYTELGWEIDKADGAHYAGRSDKAVTPNIQAAYTCRMYALATRMGVGRVHNMFICDTDGYNGGFFNRDGGFRPVAHATKLMISLMPNPRITEVIREVGGGIYVYRFDPELGKKRPPVIMAWRVGRGSKSISLDWKSKEALVMDMLGHKKTVAAKSGKITIDVGPYPVYVCESAEK